MAIEAHTNVHFINERCTSCTACVNVCPTESIYLGMNQYVIDAESCGGCKICVSVCPENAIFPLSEKAALSASIPVSAAAAPAATPKGTAPAAASKPDPKAVKK